MKIGLRDFLKNAKTDDDECGWHTGDEEEGTTISLEGAFKAIKKLSSKKQ